MTALIRATKVAGVNPESWGKSVRGSPVAWLRKQAGRRVSGIQCSIACRILIAFSSAARLVTVLKGS